MTRGEELLARWTATGLEEGEVAELARLAESDPDLLRALGRQCGLDGLLGPVMENEFSKERAVTGILRAVDDENRNHFVGEVQRKIQASRRRRFTARVAAAALVTLVLFLSFLMLRPQKVGTVVRTESIESPTSIIEGMSVRSGDELWIDRGLVEMEMAGRGRIVLEGPVRVKWLDPMRASLDHGRLFMRVTPAGRGYEVLTPAGKVIDLGTEFGVSVDEHSHLVETHVLDGEVETVVGNQDPILLKKNDALRFGTSGQERIPADSGSFYSSLPRRSEGMPPSVAWSMELVDGGLCRAESKGFGTGSFDLVSQSGRGGSYPAGVTGKVGQAVAFDGRGAFLESGFKGVGGTDPRTVCFWVRVPDDLRAEESYGIVSWGHFRSADWGGVWQISVNPESKDGPLGRLRVGAHGGTAVGTRDLRDGEWHHVAVVLYPVEEPNVGEHVLIYLDGELEPISNRTFGRIRTNVEEADHGVWVGRDITLPDQLAKRVRRGFFRGRVDELKIFGGALSRSDIHAVMEAGALQE